MVLLLYLDAEVLVLPPPVLSSGLFLLAAELRTLFLLASWEYPSPLYCLIIVYLRRVLVRQGARRQDWLRLYVYTNRDCGCGSGQ